MRDIVAFLLAQREPRMREIDLARKVGLKLTTLRSIIHDGKHPTEETIEKIAVALGKTPQEIRYGD
jgi:plasmid maintenance system antidote protein VapI